MKPETLKRIEAQAMADAERAGGALVRNITRETLLLALRDAYLRGADVGYTAAKAEGRQP